MRRLSAAIFGLIATAACQTPQREQGAASASLAAQAVCEGTLADGTSFSLRFDATGRERSLVLMTILASPPLAEELTLRAAAEPPVDPRELAFAGGGKLTLTRTAGELRAKLDWQARPEITATSARAAEVELVCDDGGSPEQGELNALTLEQMGPASLRRPLGAARIAAVELLSKAAVLVAIDAALAASAPSACEGFAQLRFLFRAEAAHAEVLLLPTVVGADCVYQRRAAPTPRPDGLLPLAAAGGLDGVGLAYPQALQEARRSFPRLTPRPAFSLSVPERLAPKVGSSYYRFLGTVCGRDGAVLVDAASGETHPGDPAPGECS